LIAADTLPDESHDRTSFPMMTPGPRSVVDLGGKSVVVTGAGGHLGRAMVAGLTAAGAVVLACGRTRETLEAAVSACAPERRASVLVEVADMGVDADVERCLDRLTAHSDHIDGWVNNAFSGVEEPGPSVARESAIRTLGAGLVDVMAATQAAARRMTASGGGSIVNVSSMYAKVSRSPRCTRPAPTFTTRRATAPPRRGSSSTPATPRATSLPMAFG